MIGAWKGRVELAEDLDELPSDIASALHRDPFDRLLVPQARIEGLTLVTGDALVRTVDPTA